MRAAIPKEKCGKEAEATKAIVRSRSDRSLSSRAVCGRPRALVSVIRAVSPSACETGRVGCGSTPRVASPVHSSPTPPRADSSTDRREGNEIHHGRRALGHVRRARGRPFVQRSRARVAWRRRDELERLQPVRGVRDVRVQRRAQAVRRGMGTKSTVLLGVSHEVHRQRPLVRPRAPPVLRQGVRGDVREGAATRTAAAGTTQAKSRVSALLQPVRPRRRRARRRRWRLLRRGVCSRGRRGDTRTTDRTGASLGRAAGTRASRENPNGRVRRGDDDGWRVEGVRRVRRTGGPSSGRRRGGHRGVGE